MTTPQTIVEREPALVELLALLAKLPRFVCFRLACLNTRTT
jgi:hypothetical protein